MKPRNAAVVLLWALLPVDVRAADVVGRVEMPPACMPEVSPAVVRLEPRGEAPPGAEGGSRGVRLVVNQRMLQFQPRVQGLSTGQVLEFTNGDAEPHNVHIQGPGAQFSRTIAPGETAEFAPERPGVYQLFCDIHVHMRGFAVVSATPWVAACDRTGSFRLREVPDGAYTLHVWHEMGRPTTREVEVSGGRVDLGTIPVEATAGAVRGPSTAPLLLPWAEVTDRVSMATAAALQAATSGAEGAAALAVEKVDDAYFVVFEGSDMEVAVGSALGNDRKIEVERKFFALRKEARAVAEGRATAARFNRLNRDLIAELLGATKDLNALGVTDRTKVRAGGAAASEARAADAGEVAARLSDLRRALDRVGALADEGRRKDAAAEVVTAYFEAFEPLERTLNLRNPSAVRPLESRFAMLRGRVDGGLAGAELRGELDTLHDDVTAAMARADAGSGSAFAVGFFASLVTILREGVEIILLLTMLTTLITRAGRPRGASRALWVGVGLAAAASVVTAVGLNQIVGAARGRTGELIEGVVMLLASGVLFYVSYWLISQAESQRWLRFLKEQAQRGSAAGGFLTLGLAAFLAVYREGAETALMYQALLTNQPPEGVAGIAAGLAAGLVLLAVIAVVLRATSLRLPMRAFFRLTGAVLFVMAVVFAGQGVLELQVAGVLKTTPAPWLGTGLPLLGLHPTLQGAAVQGLLLAGAVLAWVLLTVGAQAERPAAPGRREPAGAAVEAAARG